MASASGRRSTVAAKLSPMVSTSSGFAVVPCAYERADLPVDGVTVDGVMVTGEAPATRSPRPPSPVSSAFGLFTHARFGCVGLACWLPCLCTPREAAWARPLAPLPLRQPGATSRPTPQGRQLVPDATVEGGWAGPSPGRTPGPPAWW